MVGDEPADSSWPIQVDWNQAVIPPPPHRLTPWTNSSEQRRIVGLARQMALVR